MSALLPSDDLEEVARAICIVGGGDPDAVYNDPCGNGLRNWHFYEPHARAAIAAWNRRTAPVEANPRNWPDPLESPQAEAIRSGKIDMTDIVSLFDKMERELVQHRLVTAERMAREQTVPSRVDVARMVYRRVGTNIASDDRQALVRDILSLLGQTGEPKRYRHKKRGTTYTLIGYGNMQTENWLARNPRGQLYYSVDMHQVVIYRSEYDGALWVRPLDEFEDGRFEPLPAPPAKEGR